MEQHLSFVKPAALDLAEHVGRSLVFARNNPQRLLVLERIYSNFTPEAKARADYAASWNTLKGGAQ